MGLLDRVKHGWNAFMNKDPTRIAEPYGYSYFTRPDRIHLSRGNERSIVTSVYNRIALDVAAIDFKHCKLDSDGRFSEEMDTSLNNCLTLEPNLDQHSKAFFQDIVMSLMDEGGVAIVPTDTTGLDPRLSDSYDIDAMRVAKILEWKPAHVKVQVYNENTGMKEDIWLPKRMVCTIENPLYAVINEPNSTMQRLIRKLSLLDVTDEQTASGKLDLIIQLPYVIKTEARRQQAEQRRKDIEMQLASSQYGIAYTDGTEKVIQLNRSVENNLMKQIEYLTEMLFSQLGMTQTILDGTADEQTMVNYYNRTVQPIVDAIVLEMKRKFLSKKARSQGQTILAFRDPFKAITISNLADTADKMKRNAIMSSNEFRHVLGMKPSNNPEADKLENPNISQSKQAVNEPAKPVDEGENQNG